MPLLKTGDDTEVSKNVTSEFQSKFWSIVCFLCGILPYAILYWVAISYFSAWHCRITLFYVCWYLYDDASRKGGRASIWVRRWKIFRRIAEYFPITLEKTCDLDASQKYIVGSHPHGAYCIGAFMNFTTYATGFSEQFPGIEPYLLTHPFLHQMPGNRELLGLLGICDVSHGNIDHIMRKPGAMAVIVVGGMREAAMTDQRLIHLVINKRKGFVRMALKHGAHLIPSFTFGETELYRVRLRVFPGTKLGIFRRFFKWLFGYPPVLTEGRRGLIPYKVPVHTIGNQLVPRLRLSDLSFGFSVGTPIKVLQDINPSSEKIDALHAKYVMELCDLFERNKGRFGMDHVKLILVD